VLVDLVQVTTADGIRLDGSYQAPAADTAPTAPVDSFCLVHGTGGNFYSSTLYDELAARLRGLGHGVLRVNTRGHDGISTAQMPRGGKRQGAAYEVVDDCRHDLAAWLGWLRQHGGPRVGLVGHSMGAVKCLYSLAQSPGLAACVLALSPPRLSYEAFCTGPQGPAFLADFALAEQHVRSGRPAALMEVSLPLPLVITAAGYLEKYGPEERYNFLRLVGSVSCPALFIFGGKEVEQHPAFRGVPEALVARAERQPLVQVQTVSGADHFYTGVRTELQGRVEAWLRSLV
jgi:pimeloyl-ACP methyl ester carboxylesterase